MYLANRWGVPPEKVMEEDSVWLARQLFIDKIRNKTHGR
jgi:hypothetical protein